MRAKREMVLVRIVSAGRNRLVWEGPERFVFRRSITRQVGYGAVVHGCGAQVMARLEGEVFFRALATQVDRLDVTGPSTLRLHPGLRGLVTLPLALTGKN